MALERPLRDGRTRLGFSFERKAPFDHPNRIGEVSDLDIALVSTDLFKRARVLGLEVQSNPSRIGPLDDSAIEDLGLGKLLDRMTRELEENGSVRDIHFMLFKNEDAMIRCTR